MMNKTSNPLETIIDFAASVGADIFWVNNAKDELRRLKSKQKEWVAEVYRANEFAVQQTNEYLKLSSEIESLYKSIDTPVAYAKINERGDLYDLRLQNNPYNDQSKIIPLYRINYE